MDDLIGEFITETSESLAVLDRELGKLEQNPNDAAVLGTMFRLVHTIKGTCGFLGLPRLESVAQAGENLLGKIRDGSMAVTQQAISVMLETLDRIKLLVRYLEENGQEMPGEDRDLTRRLQAFAASDGTSAAPVTPAPAPLNGTSPLAAPTREEIGAPPGVNTAPAAHVRAAATLMALPTSGTTPALRPGIAAEISTMAREKAIKHGLATMVGDDDSSLADPSIRVRIDLLENLMRLVGELVLTRHRLMQLARQHDDHALHAPLRQLAQITSQLQEGLAHLPVTLPPLPAIIPVLLVETQGQKFAIPQMHIVELLQIGEDPGPAVATVTGAKLLRRRDRLLPLLLLREVLQLPAPAAEKGDSNGYVAVLRVGSSEFGLVVDTIHDIEEIVVKAITRVLSDVDIYCGHTVVGDGSVAMMLDPAGLYKALGGKDAQAAVAPDREH